MRNINNGIPKANSEKRINRQTGDYDKMVRAKFCSPFFTREPWYLTAARKEKERLAKLGSEKKGD